MYRNLFHTWQIEASGVLFKSVWEQCMFAKLPKVYICGGVKMSKKIVSVVVCLLLLCACCVGFAACGDDDEEPQTPLRDNAKWFTEEELTAKGLSGLTAPTGLSGDMTTNVSWFNDGYAFSQVCPDEDTFTKNAESYFDYFKNNYDGLFGTTRMEKLSRSSGETWYIIEPKTDLADYFDDNPSKMYKFYYVKDNTIVDGYFDEGCVWTFEIRYEFSTDKNAYLFKIFVESADVAHNGSLTYYYKLK